MKKILALFQLLSLRPRGPAVCEACGGPFTCGAKLGGCWCSEVEVSDEIRAELKQRYQNCLCRECLERLAANKNSAAWLTTNPQSSTISSGTINPNK